MKNVDFKALFESSPGLYLILSPEFKIMAVTDAYLQATMTVREEIVNHDLFNIFPDHTNDPIFDGVLNLRFSLNYVMDKKIEHRMDMQKYRIRYPDGSLEQKYWSPLNKPILNSNHEVIYIIHSLEDVSKQKMDDRRMETTELLLQSIIESPKDMIVLSIDRDYKYLTFNSAHKKATFDVYGVEIVRGMSLLDHIHDEDDKKKAKSNFDRAFSGEWHTTVEEFGERERYCFETRYNPIINDKNEIIGATAFAENITDRKNAENELVEANQFLDAILENIPMMLFVKEANALNFIKLNQAGEELLGYKKEMLLGKNDYDFFPKEQADFFVTNDRNVLKNGVLMDIPEEKISTINGDRWLHTKKIPLMNANGLPAYILGISEDITQKREAEAEILSMNNRLTDAYKELEAFSYSVSHDLKAPLRSLQGFSKILLENYKGRFDEDANRWLGFIEDNARRMGDLIDDILEFSKISRAEMIMVDVDMKKIAHEIFFLEKNNYPFSTIQFNLGNLPYVRGDQSMIKLVWQNLISNAIKYSSKNGTILIEITGNIKNGEAVFSIKDNGAGFDEKYIEKLFGVFQRLHSNADFEGTGVGLAIVNKIIQKHNGWISASSKVGVGTEFRFALPTKT